MNKSIIGLVSVIAVILVAGGIFFISSKNSNNANSSNVNPPATTAQNDQTTSTNESNQQDLSSEPGNTSISTSEVSQHASADDCWTIIDGQVYDITSYIPRHPGGDEILRACGADGSTLFNTRTTQDGEKVGSGTPHSSSASTQLHDFSIGKLQN